MVLGRASYPFASGQLVAALSYTLRVQSTTLPADQAFDIDYDPDLEIKP